jgi:hypothetical protein
MWGTWLIGSCKCGRDPLTALDAGTFTPGDVNDNTGKGNTCDVATDEKGCIFTQNLLVLVCPSRLCSLAVRYLVGRVVIDRQDATEAEITAAVGGAGAGATASNNANKVGKNGNSTADATAAASPPAQDLAAPIDAEAGVGSIATAAVSASTAAAASSAAAPASSVSAGDKAAGGDGGKGADAAGGGKAKSGSGSGASAAGGAAGIDIGSCSKSAS